MASQHTLTFDLSRSNVRLVLSTDDSSGIQASQLMKNTVFPIPLSSLFVWSRAHHNASRQLRLLQVEFGSSNACVENELPRLALLAQPRRRQNRTNDTRPIEEIDAKLL
jgi:hypothetical protein